MLLAGFVLSAPEVYGARLKVEQEIEQSITAQGEQSITCSSTQSLYSDGTTVKKYQSSNCSSTGSMENNDSESDDTDAETNDMLDKGLTCTEKSLNIIFGGTFFEIEKTESGADGKKKSKGQVIHCTPIPCWFDIFGSCGNPGVITSDEQD